jgi:hypothetical protein
MLEQVDEVGRMSRKHFAVSEAAFYVFVGQNTQKVTISHDLLKPLDPAPRYQSLPAHQAICIDHSLAIINMSLYSLFHPVHELLPSSPGFDLETV